MNAASLLGCLKGLWRHFFDGRQMENSMRRFAATLNY
jgi:hypothetical protein